MKKAVKVVLVILAFAAVFTLGCFMPKLWPAFLNKVIYPVFPQLKTTTQEDLYEPYYNAQLGDPISENDSVIYYFYKDYCPWCKQLEPLTAGLPDKITLPDGTVSNVKLICLNKVEDRYLEIITEYYESHNIPEERRFVPAIVIGDKYLFTYEEITPELMKALVAGDGVKTPLLDGNERVKG